MEEVEEKDNSDMFIASEKMQGESYTNIEDKTVMFKPQVNPKSEKLAAKVHRGEVAHNRLHSISDHKKKLQIESRRAEKERQQWEADNNPLAPEYEPMNDGERLHHRSRANRGKEERKAIRKKRAEKRKEWSKYTLNPIINQLSQKFKRSYKTPVEASLMDTKYFTEERIYQ